MERTKTCVLTDEQKEYILTKSKTKSFSYVVSQLFGKTFSLEQTLAVYTYMNRHKCFDFVSNLEFHNDVLKLAKEGMTDNEIFEELKDKYKNIGVYQVMSVVIANSKSRRVGRWEDADQRVLRFLYGANSKKAFLQVLYPRLLANIQKQASRLQLHFEEPATHIGVSTKDCLTVGELREILSEYKDDDKFYITQIGSPEPVQIIRVGHKSGNRGEHLNPTVTIWDI